MRINYKFCGFFPFSLLFSFLSFIELILIQIFLYTNSLKKKIFFYIQLTFFFLISFKKGIVLLGTLRSCEFKVFKSIILSGLGVMGLVIRLYSLPLYYSYLTLHGYMRI